MPRFINLLQEIQSKLGEQPDLKYHQFRIDSTIPTLCIYFDTLIDKNQLQKFIITPLLEMKLNPEVSAEEHIACIKDKVAAIPYTQESQLVKCTQLIMEGKCLLILDSEQMLAFDITKYQHRNIEEPKSEKVVRGPQEGFTKDLMTNVSLIRKRVRSASLMFESFEIGTTTKTSVWVAYHKEKVQEPLLEEIRSRLLNIQIDSVFESANIEDLIQEKAITPFPTMLNTERPDVVCSHLVEGRIAILTSGTPMALILPMTFFQFFVSPEDYYQKAYIGTIFRWLRLLAFLLSVYVPSMYIVLTNYRQEMLPSSLLISISAQRESVPFPAIVEAIIMLLIFELLREAGIRMPKVTGQAISIVGAVVLGQAAVEAGLVSAAMVIVVGVTAITNFVSPSFSFSITQRILQVCFMFLGIFVGMFGILSGTIALVIHLVSLQSYGSPYFAPVAPTLLHGLKDTLIRRSWKNLKKNSKG